MEVTNYHMQRIPHFEKWFNEYMGVEVIQCEHGFMTYRIQDDVCVIYDMYVDPESRGNKVSAKMADMITVKAIEEGCKSLIGFVNIPSPYPEQSLLCQLKYGFKIKELLPNKIVLEKEIKNG